MKPHPRIRKSVKWGGLAVIAVLTVVWSASAWVTVEYIWGTWGRTVCVSHGTVFIGNYFWSGQPPAHGWIVYVAERPELRWRLSWGIEKWTQTPHLRVPLWLPTLGAIWLTLTAWWSDARARRRQTGIVCSHCGYSRRGLPPSTPCPECGRNPSTS